MTRLLPVLWVFPLLLVNIQHAGAHHLWGKSQKYIDKALGWRIHKTPYQFDRLRLEPVSKKRHLAGFSNQVQHVRLWKKASAGVL
jgi:hypothetical protein